MRNIAVIQINAIILQFVTKDFEGNIIEFHQTDKKSKKFLKK